MSGEVCGHMACYVPRGYITEHDIAEGAGFAAPSQTEKWREAGWKSPDDILSALTALQLRVREVRDGFTPMIAQGSGAYLNPRVVVARLDAALAPAPVPDDAEGKG